MQNNPISPKLAALIEQRNKPGTQPFDMDEATAELLAAISGHGNGILPAAAWQTLQRRNEALLTQPHKEVLKSLAAQSCLLEALIGRHIACSLQAPKPSQSEAHLRLALGCNRALVNVLGAINVVAEAHARDTALIADDDNEDA